MNSGGLFILCYAAKSQPVRRIGPFDAQESAGIQVFQPRCRLFFQGRGRPQIVLIVLQPPLPFRQIFKSFRSPSVPVKAVAAFFIYLEAGPLYRLQDAFLHLYCLGLFFREPLRFPGFAFRRGRFGAALMGRRGRGFRDRLRHGF